MTSKPDGEKQKKEWVTPELIVHGPIEKITGWFSFGSHTELFGGSRRTPIDWGLDPKSGS